MLLRHRPNIKPSKCLIALAIWNVIIFTVTAVYSIITSFALYPSDARAEKILFKNTICRRVIKSTYTFLGLESNIKEWAK